jgi:hypothetical protein
MWIRIRIRIRNTGLSIVPEGRHRARRLAPASLSVGGRGRAAEGAEAPHCPASAVLAAVPEPAVVAAVRTAVAAGWALAHTAVAAGWGLAHRAAVAAWAPVHTAVAAGWAPGHTAVAVGWEPGRRAPAVVVAGAAAVRRTAVAGPGVRGARAQLRTAAEAVWVRASTAALGRCCTAGQDTAAAAVWAAEEEVEQSSS